MPSPESPQVKTRAPDRLKPALDVTVPKVAMILAAGLGKRMRPLTDDRPKPMVELQGRPIIDHALMKLQEAGITHLVVNLHYKGDILRGHLEKALPAGMSIAFSEETDLLDTGGGIRNALPHLGDSPFFAINGDIFWRDGTVDTFSRLAQRWNEAEMDALLLMTPTVSARGYDGLGDFVMDPAGQLLRRSELRVAPFIYGGIQLLHPRLFADAPEGAFSMNRLWDRAIEAERLYGLRHEGDWMHIGTPDSLAIADALLAE